jgi:hypothetical protein
MRRVTIRVRGGMRGGAVQARAGGARRGDGPRAYEGAANAGARAGGEREGVGRERGAPAEQLEPLLQTTRIPVHAHNAHDAGTRESTRVQRGDAR